MKLTRLCSGPAACLMALVLIAANPALGEELLATGITRPSKEMKLSFYQAGLIKEVLVKDGDHVKKGDVLVQQDDSIEQKTLAALQVEAESELAIHAQIKDMEHKKVIMERKKRMLEQGTVASRGEYEEALLEYELSSIRVDLAKQELAIKRTERDRQAQRIELMKLRAPADGVVALVRVHEGEFADPQRETGSVVLVVRDPLHVEIRDLSRSQTRHFKLGQELQVRYDENDEWKPARIIYLAEVDPASDTQLVRLEMSNPQDQVSGQRVQVKLPEELAAAAR
jgi:multidrug efflux pump subunit AcrA (membrane-fusion protein)